MNHQRIPILLVLISLCTSAMAWVDDRPEGAKFYPEQSQAQVELQQREQRTMGELGNVPRRQGESRLDVEPTDAGAADNLAAATVKSPETERGSAVLKEAARQRNGESSRGPAWWWGAIVAGVGFGAFYALKVYADKTVPEPQKSRPIQW